MKNNYKIKSRVHRFFISLLVFLLAFATLAPSNGLAYEDTIDVTLTINNATVVTEKKLNTGSHIITLTLANPSKKWAVDLNDKKQLVLDSMVANVESDKWKDYKKRIKVRRKSDSQLEITLAKDSQYVLHNNQEITLNLSAALIENWEGQVGTTSFTIYAKPEITLGGSILSATEEDIRKGGKAIELNLLNAKWDKVALSTLTNWNQLLNGFKMESNQATWSAVALIKQADPNTVISYRNDDRTLVIELPPINDSSSGGTVNFNHSVLKNKIVVDEDLGSTVFAGEHLSFEIQLKSGLAVNSSSVNEAQINKTGSVSMDLTLRNANWSNLTDAKKQLLIDSLVAKNLPEEWGKVKESLTVDYVSSNRVKITIPQVVDYHLSEDQVISLEVPYQLLVNDVEINPVEFMIQAKPKALIGGTVTPNVSQADIVKGGKTIEVKLVNATWASEIASKTATREKLLNGFDGFTPAALSMIKAKAHVVRTNDQLVTITLPPVNGYKISSNENIGFELKNSDHLARNSNQVSINSSVDEAFTVTPVTGISVDVLGTIMSNTNEFDIANGGKTITLKLKNDVWAKNILPIKNALMNSSIQAAVDKIERISDTEVKITLKPVNFVITEDLPVNVVIPKELLSTSSRAISVNSAFTIAAVRAEVTGTALTSLNPTEIQKGGKTIIVSLENASFKTGSQFSYADLLDGMTVNNGSASQHKAWESVTTALEAEAAKYIKVTSNKVTIKLPPVLSYSYEAAMEIELQIKKGLIKNASKNIPGDKIINIGQTAGAKLTGSSISETKLVGSTNKLVIELEGPTWDPTITSNKSKQNTLLKGFDTEDQSKEWSAVVNAIKAKGSFTLVNNKKLEIKIPAVHDYAIVRNQIIDITIPKSVLNDYNYDIEVAQNLYIMVPKVTPYKSLGKLLQEDFDEYIKTDFEEIRLEVPRKNIETITTNTVDLSATQSITTIKVETTEEVRKMVLTLRNKEGVEKTFEATKEKGEFLFVLNNLPINSEVKLTTYGSGSNPLQADIYKKISKGNKTINELPKSDLTGSYSLYKILTDKKLLKEILKYYSVDDLQVGK